MLALTTCCVALLVSSAQAAAFVFLGCMLAGGLITVVDSRRASRQKAYEAVLKQPDDKGVLKRMGIPQSVGVCLVLFAVGLFVLTQILIYLPAGSFGSGDGDKYIAVFSSLYKMGISIYGGGQVVLPLLWRIHPDP